MRKPYIVEAVAPATSIGHPARVIREFSRMSRDELSEEALIAESQAQRAICPELVSFNLERTRSNGPESLDELSLDAGFASVHAGLTEAGR